MSTVAYVPLPRADVISYLGPAWPAAVGATILRPPADSGITDGAVAVYETPGQPGLTWWLVDGVVVPQPSGLVDEVLAALIPGSVLEVVPDLSPDPEQPPITYPHGLTALDSQ